MKGKPVFIDTVPIRNGIIRQGPIEKGKYKFVPKLA